MKKENERKPEKPIPKNDKNLETPAKSQLISK